MNRPKTANSANKKSAVKPPNAQSEFSKEV